MGVRPTFLVLVSADCISIKFFFLNALVLYFYLEHVQRITFCRCFLIFNQAVFCVDDGVVLWLKIKNPTTKKKSTS